MHTVLLIGMDIDFYFRLMYGRYTMCTKMHLFLNLKSKMVLKFSNK